MSLKASELRIGNKVFRGGLFGEPQIEITITASEIYELSVCENSAHDFAPIPLTEEWLTKFGYVLFPWGWVKEKSPLICFNPLKKEFWVELGNGFRIELPYVHTLQNFIALTGEELKYEG